MPDEKGMQDLVSRLEQDLDKEKKSNKNFDMVGIGFVVVIGGYLTWLSFALGSVLQPQNLAEATAGMAIDAAPAVTAHMRELVVDGAPNLASAASQAVVDLVPNYRAMLEEELRPVIDEVSKVVAETAVTRMVGSGAEVPQGVAMQEAADAAVARLDGLLTQAMDEPMGEDDPSTPRQVIEKSLTQLQSVDRGLKALASGRGDRNERELVLAWLNVVAQQDEGKELELREAYQQGKAP